MRKNQYEEALFRCEDDRYELDMCIETNSSTIKKLLPLKEMFDKMGVEERANYRLEENSLSPIHYRAIERIYGDAVSRGAAAVSNNERRGEWRGLTLKCTYSLYFLACLGPWTMTL
jgi:histone deacetylase complex regulatory component SIN3